MSAKRTTTNAELGERIARLEALIEGAAANISDIKRMLERQGCRINRLEQHRRWITGLAAGIGAAVGAAGAGLKGLM